MQEIIDLNICFQNWINSCKNCIMQEFCRTYGKHNVKKNTHNVHENNYSIWRSKLFFQQKIKEYRKHQNKTSYTSFYIHFNWINCKVKKYAKKLKQHNKGKWSSLNTKWFKEEKNFGNNLRAASFYQKETEAQGSYRSCLMWCSQLRREPGQGLHVSGLPIPS